MPKKHTIYIMNKSIIYRPILNNILVLPRPLEEQIVVPELAHVIRGEVRELGTGAKDEWIVKVGDIVWFDKLDGSSLQLNDDLYYVVEQKHILVREF